MKRKNSFKDETRENLVPVHDNWKVICWYKLGEGVFTEGAIFEFRDRKGVYFVFSMRTDTAMNIIVRELNSTKDITVNVMSTFVRVLRLKTHIKDGL